MHRKSKNSTPVLLGMLRYLSISAAMFVLFPLLFLTETFCQAQTVIPTLLFRFVLLIICGFMGFFVSRLCKWTEKKWKVPAALQHLLRLIGAVCPAIFLMACCRFDFGSLRTYALIFYGLTAYLLGAIYYFRPYAKVNTKVTLAWLCSLHLAAMILIALLAFTYNHAIVAADQVLPAELKLSAAQTFFLDAGAEERIYAQGFQYNFSVFIPEFLIYISIYGMVLNQSHIDFLMERRKHNMEDLPRWVRTYNLGLTSGIMAVIALLFLCKDWMIAGFQWTAKIIGYVIYRILNWVGSLFMNQAISTETMEGFMENSDRIEDAAEAAAGNPRSAMVISYMLVAAILVLLIWLIWRFRLFSKIWEMLRRAGSALANQLKGENAAGRKAVSGEPEYIDSETELDEKSRKSKKRDGSSAFQQWRKDYRKFQKITGESRRYEEGFLLLTEYFKLRGVPIDAGDTALQISRKAVKSKKIAALSSDSITEGYHLLCYAQSGCKQDKLAVLEEALQKAYSDSKSLKTVGV